MTQSVFITGAGSGLGRVTAELFAAHGWQVFAADLTPPSPEGSIVPVVLDVTDSASCEAAAKTVSALCDGLAAVVNFAGVLEIGPLVEVDEALMRRSLEVNVMGTFLVNQAMFPLVRQGGGRIVNISSDAGKHKAQAVSAPYSVSKHAVEAYSDALRRELMFVDVPVVVVQPGAFRTAMSASISERFARAARPDSPFAPLVAKVGAFAAKSENGSKDPEILARAVHHAVTVARPRARYSVGGARGSGVLDRLPDRTVDRIMRRLLG